MENNMGTFYGIGVGPGDPELITMKAIRILQRVDVVFAAASTKNNHSLAVSIAKPHIPEATRRSPGRPGKKMRISYINLFQRAMMLPF